MGLQAFTADRSQVYRVISAQYHASGQQSTNREDTLSASPSLISNRRQMLVFTGVAALASTAGAANAEEGCTQRSIKVYFPFARPLLQLSNLLFPWFGQVFQLRPRSVVNVLGQEQSRVICAVVLESGEL